MSEQPTGYALTVLACKLGLYPPEVEGNTEDGFRYTDPETGYSVAWEPHRNVHQARIVFWDLVPLRGGMRVQGNKCWREHPSRIIGYYEVRNEKVSQSPIVVAWSNTDPQLLSEAEALVVAACKAIGHS